MSQDISRHEVERWSFECFKAQNRTLIAAASYTPILFNADTPVDFNEYYSSDVTDVELPVVLNLLNLTGLSDTKEGDTGQQIERWFGRSFGRIVLIGSKLVKLWNDAKKHNPHESLEHFYYQARTLQQLFDARMMAELGDEMKQQIKAFFLGTLDDTAKRKLISYGILGDDGDWTCDLIQRFYFTQVFHSTAVSGTLFARGSIPLCSKLLYVGLSKLSWSDVGKNVKSSKDAKIPIEDTWQTVFYMAIGKFIPRNMVFCKERASKSGHLDFMLRDGKKLGIELLIESRKVDEHHERFEEGGNYADLQLDDYIVCDIVVAESSEDVPKRVVESFEKASTLQRKRVHSVFLVNHELSRDH